MRQRLSLAAIIASAAIALGAGAALAKEPPVGAGGWATVRLDPGTSAPTAGKAVTIGFTLLQRGEAPISQGEVVVNATGPDGQQLSFPARAQGTAGHWVVEMTLPSAGAWDWAVAMPDELPVLTHLASLRVAAPTPPPATGGSPLPIVLAAAAAVLALVLLLVMRGGMRTVAARALERP
jgi:hypothetical protein